MSADAIADLIERLEQAALRLEGLKKKAWEPVERARLHGKVEGVNLALSYVREVQP